MDQILLGALSVCGAIVLAWVIGVLRKDGDGTPVADEATLLHACRWDPLPHPDYPFGNLSVCRGCGWTRVSIPKCEHLWQHDEVEGGAERWHCILCGTRSLKIVLGSLRPGESVALPIQIERR